MTFSFLRRYRRDTIIRYPVVKMPLVLNWKLSIGRTVTRSLEPDRRAGHPAPPHVSSCACPRRLSPAIGDKSARAAPQGSAVIGRDCQYLLSGSPPAAFACRFAVKASRFDKNGATTSSRYGAFFVMASTACSMPAVASWRKRASKDGLSDTFGAAGISQHQMRRAGIGGPTLRRIGGIAGCRQEDSVPAGLIGAGEALLHASGRP